MSKSVMSSASDATVSIFDMVSGTATQATKLVSSVGVSIDMFDRFVRDAEERQAARSAINKEKFYKELAEDTALEISKRQEEIQRELQGNQAFAKLYSENYTELQETISKFRASRD